MTYFSSSSSGCMELLFSQLLWKKFLPIIPHRLFTEANFFTHLKLSIDFSNEQLNSINNTCKMIKNQGTLLKIICLFSFKQMPISGAVWDSQNWENRCILHTASPPITADRSRKVYLCVCGWHRQGKLGGWCIETGGGDDSGLQGCPSFRRVTEGQKLRFASPPLGQWKIEDLLGW